jgi:predicted ferric reductase
MPEDKAARLAAIRAANAVPAAPKAAVVPQNLDDLPPVLAGRDLLILLLAVAAGALIAALFLPALAGSLSNSLTGTEPKAPWYLARASAFVAYILLWLSMVFGLLMTSKAARLWPGGPAAFELHQHASLLGLAFALFHGLVLLGDAYIGFTVGQVLTPFSTSYKPFETGMGQLAFYGLAIIGGSFYVRNRIGRQAWRILHFVSFAVYLMALWHGVAAGTDSAEPWAAAIYWLSGAALLFLIVYRVLMTQVAKKPAPRRTVA